MGTKILTVTIALTVSLVYADDIAFFYALDADLKTFKAEGIEARQPVKVGGRAIQVFTIGKHKIYTMKMGSGVVETTISAQALLARFRCARAFSIGAVGSLSDKAEKGKWYRVGVIVPYQKGAWTGSGFQLGKTPVPPDVNATKMEIPLLFCNLSSIAVASGEIFVASNSYREQLRRTANTDAVDMNLFGLAAVCLDHHVPLINWRMVSDNADDNAAVDFAKFTEMYDGAGGKALAELIRKLPPNPDSPESYPELQKLLQRNNEGEKR